MPDTGRFPFADIDDAVGSEKDVAGRSRAEEAIENAPGFHPSMKLAAGLRRSENAVGQPTHWVCHQRIAQLKLRLRMVAPFVHRRQIIQF
jgi:hypothetical protein